MASDTINALPRIHCGSCTAEIPAEDVRDVLAAGRAELVRELRALPEWQAIDAHEWRERVEPDALYAARIGADSTEERMASALSAIKRHLEREQQPAGSER